MPIISLPTDILTDADSPDGANIIVGYIPAMTNARLQYAIEVQITASEVATKALALAQTAAYGNSVMLLMPGETAPRFLTSDELAAVSGESTAAASAVTLLAGVGSGEQVVIAQGASFQMVAFKWTWTV
jgi:hypothetical protein